MHSQTPKSSMSPDPFQDSHSRWLALTQRAPSSHSSFLYGVKSTKIYCRPTCSARLARRANVVFYDTEDQARRDGFRPCMRCKPDVTTFVGEGEEIVGSVLALLRIEKDDMTMKGSLKELAKEVGVTPSYLCRVFKKTMGVTVGEYRKEFEKEGSERTKSSTQTPRNGGLDVVDVVTGLLTPAKRAESPSAPLQSWEGGPPEKDVRNLEEAQDLGFDIDEWLWTEAFSDDSIDGGNIQGSSTLPLTA
ncbi:metal binding domain of Ada-domain-containing protein [Usnea florida]